MLRLPTFPVLLLLCLRLCAQTTLSGNIGGMTLEQAGRPYTVTETITIQSGKTTTIKAGCVFLFKPFTGLEVRGTLTATGTQEAPVVFTSAYDAQYNQKSEQMANPFDWNGILVGGEAQGVHLSNFMLCYSVFGIKSLQAGIVIENGIFRQNGQYHFTINESVKAVQDNFPYSYNADKKIKDSVTRKPARPLKVASVCAGVAGVACAIAAVPFFSKAARANSDGNNARLQADIEAARKRESSAIVSASILAGSAGLLLPTAVVLYMMDNRKDAKPKKVTLAPILGSDGAGISLLFRF